MRNFVISIYADELCGSFIINYNATQKSYPLKKITLPIVTETEVEKLNFHIPPLLH